MASKLELQVIARDQASKVLKGIRGDIKDLGSAAGNSRGALSQMFSVAGGDVLARGIASAASAMVGLGKAAVGAVADMVNASASMNAQVSGIGAVLGLTQGELVKVKDLINQLGVDPNLKVNAQEAANAIDMLARNGLTLDQILGGAARATVFLANATGGTFDTSANVATDSMAMFKIKAEDMMTAVDGITSVTVASKFGLDDYQRALSQAGGVASALGVEFDDFNTTIAATSSSFASGSDAGTSYKTFLQRLVPQSDEAVNAMGELGLYGFNAEKAMTTLGQMGIKPLSNDMGTLIDQLMKGYAATNKVNLGTEEGLASFNDWARETGFVQNAFYDANGQMKSMADISSTLSQATSGLTEEQKNQYLTTIFGSDAMRTAFGLAEKGQVVYTDVAKAAKELGVSQEDLAKYAEGGITAFEALQATMGKTDALKGAQMRMDNLAGDMEIFGGIVDSVKIQIGDKFDPVLRNVFQGLTATFTQMMPQILAFGDAIANNVAAAIQRLSSAFTIFQSGGSIADIGATLGISPTIVEMISFAAQNIDILVGALGGIATVIGGSAVISGIAAAIGALLSPMTLVIAGAALLGAAWNTNFGGIQEKTQAVWGVVQPVLTQVWTWAQVTLPLAFASLQSVSMAAWASIQASVATALTAAQPALSSIWTWISVTLPASMSILQTTASTAWSAIQSSVTAAWGAIQPALTQLWSWVQLVIPVAMAGLQAAASTAWTAIQSTIATAWSAIQPVITQLWTWIQTTLPAAFAAIAPAATAAWSAVQSAVSAAWGVIQPVLLQAWTWMQLTLPLSMSGIGASATAAWGSFSTAISTAWASAQAVFGQITASVGGLIIMLSAVFGPSLTRLGQSITSAFSGLGTLGPQFTGLQTAITNMITAVQPIIQGLGMVIGAVFGVVSVVAINGLSTLIGNLPASIGIAIDQLTLTFNTIGDTLTAVVGIVTGLLSGDFAGAWESAKSLVSTSVTFMLGSLTNLSAAGALLMGALKTFITGTFSDLASVVGIDNITTQLQTVKDTITTFFTGEGNIFSTAFSVIVDAPAWLADLTGWTWPALTDLLAWAWPSYDTWTWPDYNAWAWADYNAWTWPTYNTFTWPDFPTPQWVSDLLNWSPVVTITGAVSNAAGAVGNAATSAYDTITGLFDTNADGTRNFEGGWTWVGERGPELLNLPKGSEILSNTESKKMIGGLADGTTTAAATGGAPRPQQGNVFSAIANAAKNFGQAGTNIQKAASAMSKSVKDLEAGLRKVPGLFGTSQVTEKQQRMGELGIPQNFADDWIRRLTDEVVNGVDWEGVDIKDAAMRAGLDPALPAEAILELVTDKWNDKSLFANPENLDLINQEAVQAALAQQAQQAAGEQNLLALFGVTPAQAGVAGTTTGTAAGAGMLAGLTQSLTDSNAGTQVATAIGTGVTAESMAPAGATVVSGLATEMKKEEYSAQIGGALSALFTGYLDKADAFTDVAQRIMTRISAQFGNVTGLDMVSKFTDAFRAQLGTDEAIASLSKVGEKILELVFRGYLDEARKRNWAEGVNAKGDTTSTTPDETTTTAGNAIGTRSWRGGMTWVGETGPELVSLPARSRIFSPSESMALAGAGGGDVHVVINATVSSAIDIEQMAYRVADVIRRRR